MNDNLMSSETVKKFPSCNLSCHNFNTEQYVTKFEIQGTTSLFCW